MLGVRVLGRSRLRRRRRRCCRCRRRLGSARGRGLLDTPLARVGGGGGGGAADDYAPLRDGVQQEVTVELELRSDVIEFPKCFDLERNVPFVRSSPSVSRCA